MSDERTNDDLVVLSREECAVVLSHAEADALLAVMEKALNAGIVPGIGLPRGLAESAAFKVVRQRAIASDPYDRGSRIVAAVWRPSTVTPFTTSEDPAGGARDA